MSDAQAGLAVVSVGLEQRETAPAATRMSLRPVVLFAATLAAVAGIGWFYAGAMMHTWDPRALSPEYKAHLASVLGCLCGVLLFATRAHGPIERKLTETAIFNALVHGVLAFVILGGRLTFVRPVLLTNGVAALLLGMAVVLLKHRISRPRVAVVRPLALDVNAQRPLGEMVTSPATDLSAYDVVLVSLTDGISKEWARALSRAMLAGSQVRHVGEYLEEARGAVSVDHFELDQINTVGLVSYRPWKRFVDVAVVIFFAPLTLLLVALGAIAVLMSMGRPVFFVQERVGLAGKPFKIIKLRTMRPSAAGQASRATIAGDPRVTRVGAVLRRFRIDELPQVWNVLRGEMSLIGPRPEAVAFHEDYLREVPEYAYRNLVRPGITGWAQVSAPPSANAHEARRKLSYDLYYVKRMSLFLDLQIALRTVWTVTNGGGVR